MAVESSSEPIRGWGLVRWQILDACPNLLIGEGDIKSGKVMNGHLQSVKVHSLSTVFYQPKQLRIELKDCMLFVILGREYTISHLQLSDKKFLLSMPSMKMEKGRISITLLQPTDSWPETRYCAFKRGQPKAFFLQVPMQPDFIIRKLTS